MWSSPEAKTVPMEYNRTGGAHADITRNFCQSILFDVPLISPGEEGLNAVELIDGMILAGHTGKTVSVPVNRAAFNKLLDELKATSSEKSQIKEQRVLDPHYA